MFNYTLNQIYVLSKKLRFLFIFVVYIHSSVHIFNFDSYGYITNYLNEDLVFF